MQDNQNYGQSNTPVNQEQTASPQQGAQQKQAVSGQRRPASNGRPSQGTPQRRRANKKKRVMQRMAIVIGVIVAIFLVIFALGASWGKNRGTKLTEENIKQQLSSLSSLSECSYNYTNVVSFGETEDFYGWDASDYSSLNISYDGKITAAIDPEKITVAISGKNVTITLPEATVTANEITESSLAVYSSNSGEFQSIALTDFAGFVSSQQPTAQAKATTNGLLFDSAEKAKQAAIVLVESLAGSRKDSYQITVQ